MDVLEIFVLQVVFSLILWGLVAKWAFVPQLVKMTWDRALFWLILPHAFRHVGMVFLVPGMSSGDLPDNFTIPTAYGDLISAVLAIVSISLLRAGKSIAVVLIWIFNIVGSVDLILALTHAEAVPFLGATWYIPTMFVPLLLVTHAMIFMHLLKKKG